jgi:hypothetical protein
VHDRDLKRFIQEKTRAAAAPMKPKKGAISSPLKTVDIFQTDCQMSKQIEFSFKTCKISTCPVSKILHKDIMADHLPEIKTRKLLENSITYIF